MRIYLRNGQIIENDDELMAINRSGLGSFVGLKWNHRQGHNSLYFIDINEIVAICNDYREDESGLTHAGADVPGASESNQDSPADAPSSAARGSA